MAAAEGVVLASGGDVTDVAVALQVKAIGCDLALSDRCAEPEGCVNQHRTVRGLTQSAARGTRVNERLNQHRHRRVSGVEIVSGHVAQRSRGPERGPTGPDGGDELRFLFEPQVALELSGKARPESILDE